jgi:hypothetical protein
MNKLEIAVNALKKIANIESGDALQCSYNAGFCKGLAEKTLQQIDFDADQERFDKIEICTYSKDNLCTLLEGGMRICGGLPSVMSGKCPFYIGLRNTNKE